MGITVRQEKGIQLPECGVWLDPSRKQALGIVTHAHSDHATWHEETLATPATLALMRARMSKPRGTLREIGFHEPISLPGCRMTLLPAGHILGSAQVFIERENETLLYTGDFKLRSGLTSEAATAVRADTLILETTFGRPSYRFPPAEELWPQIHEFCHLALADGQIPVLLAYSLGKAQELIAGLAATGLPVAVHPAVAKMTAVYETFGVRFPTYEVFDFLRTEGRVIICPPNARNALGGLPNVREALISGWALDARAKYQFRCHSAFALSDHAGYDDLLRHLEAVAPKRVYTVHGFTEAFASDLRRRGIEAWALGGTNQLELGLAA